MQLPDQNWKKRFRGRLFRWFEKNARKLPWRESRDPYRIWISEIMLQQTQVNTVESYYPRFLERFPDITSLAAAEETEVLRYWEGLGYYRRAVQMHRAAKVMDSEYGGRFPEEFDTVFSLPGIGRYTAGAILSISHDHRLPVLEANTVRLFSRLLAYPEDPTRGEGNRLLWKMAESVLPKKDVGIFNQALMELGSLICIPNHPPCRNCPVFPLCGTFAEGKQNEIPRRKIKTAITAVEELAVLVESERGVLMIRYPEGVRWAGLWDFPRIALTEKGQASTPSGREAIETAFFEQTGYPIELGEEIETFRHSVTRYRITLHCHHGTLRSTSLSRKSSPSTTQPSSSPLSPYQTKWVAKQQLNTMPMNTTGRKMCPLV